MPARLQDIRTDKNQMHFYTLARKQSQLHIASKKKKTTTHKIKKIKKRSIRLMHCKQQNAKIKDLNKWKDTTSSPKWHFPAREDLMLLMAIFPNMIYTINKTLIKIPGCFVLRKLAS